MKHNGNIRVTFDDKDFQKQIRKARRASNFTGGYEPIMDRLQFWLCVLVVTVVVVIVGLGLHA